MTTPLTIPQNVSSQFTQTEQLIGGGGPPENYADYTVTESRPASPVVSWLPEVLAQLQAIAVLPEGWDSYGASSPDINKLKAAWCLLLCLCEDTGLPRPHVNPTPSGGVQFEWELGERYFELEIVAERAATYLYCDDDAHLEETGDVFEEESLEPMLAYIRKVASFQ